MVTGKFAGALATLATLATLAKATFKTCLPVRVRPGVNRAVALVRH